MKKTAEFLELSIRKMEDGEEKREKERKGEKEKKPKENQKKQVHHGFNLKPALKSFVLRIIN